MMNKQEHIEYWIKTAEHDYPAIENNFKSKDYTWSLYIGHLVIEKLIKAHYVKDVGLVPPKTHDLVKLISKTSVYVSDDEKVKLNRINKFNLESRYPNEKLAFYKKCDKEFCEKNIEIIKEVYSWLRSLI